MEVVEELRNYLINNSFKAFILLTFSNNFWGLLLYVSEPMHVIRLYFFLKIKFLLKSLTNNLLYTFFNLAWDKDFVEISAPSIDDFG